MLQQSVFMLRQSLVKTKSFYVATELAKVKRNYVTAEFGQSQELLCRDRVWPWMGFLCCDRVILHCDEVWPRHEILGRA